MLLQPAEIVGQLPRQRSRRQCFHHPSGRFPFSGEPKASVAALAFGSPLNKFYPKRLTIGMRSASERPEGGRDENLPMVWSAALPEALPSSLAPSPEKAEYRSGSGRRRGTGCPCRERCQG